MELMKVGFTAAVASLFKLLAAGNKAGAPRDTDNENRGCYESTSSSHLDYFHASKRQFKSFQLEIPVTSKQ